MRTRILSVLVLALLTSACGGRSEAREGFDPKLDSEAVAECYAAYKNVVIYVVRPVPDADMDIRVKRAQESEAKLSPYVDAAAQALGGYKFHDRAARLGLELGGGILADPSKPNEVKYSVVARNLGKISTCDLMIEKWSKAR